MTMCSSEDLNPLQPLGAREMQVWDKSEKEKLDHIVTIALWGKKMDPVKKKVTNNLHNYELTFGEVVARFDEELPKLRNMCK